MSIAPMMDWTDRHCRYFHRLLTRHTLLYTEMVNAGAIIHGGTVYAIEAVLDVHSSRRELHLMCKAVG